MKRHGSLKPTEGDRQATPISRSMVPVGSASRLNRLTSRRQTSKDCKRSRKSASNSGGLARASSFASMRATLARIAIVQCHNLAGGSHLGSLGLGVMHERRIVIHQCAREVTDGEPIGPYLRHWRYFGSGAGNETLGELSHLLRHHGPLYDLPAPLLAKPDDPPPLAPSPPPT